MAITNVCRYSQCIAAKTPTTQTVVKLPIDVVCSVFCKQEVAYATNSIKALRKTPVVSLCEWINCRAKRLNWNPGTFSKFDAEIVSSKTPPPGWVGMTGYKINKFSRQSMIFPRLLNFWPLKIPPHIPLGWSGSNFVGFEWFPDQSAHACQIWLQSDGRVEKGGYRQTKGHCIFKLDCSLCNLNSIIMSNVAYTLTRFQHVLDAVLILLICIVLYVLLKMCQRWNKEIDWLINQLIDWLIDSFSNIITQHIWILWNIITLKWYNYLQILHL